MSGYIGTDGSNLVGALNPSSVIQGLQVDASGNLKTVAAGSPAETPANINQINGVAPSRTNGLPIGGDNGSTVVVLPLEALNNLLKTSVYGKSTNPGDTPLLLDASGRLQVNVAQQGGQNTALASSDGQTAATVPLEAVGGYNGATIDRILADLKALRVSLYGKGNGSAGDTAFLLDSAGRLQNNLAQWNGAAPSVTNPVITEDQLRAWIVNGQGFSATSGKQTSSGSGNGLACLFAPANATKNILIYSIQAYCATAGTIQLSYITADPALGSSITPQNANLGSGTASVATAEYTATIGAISGTVVSVLAAGNNTVIDLLGAGGNGSYIYLPSGQAGIHGVEVAVATSTNVFAITFRWVEF